MIEKGEREGVVERGLEGRGMRGKGNGKGRKNIIYIAGQTRTFSCLRVPDAKVY